MCASPQGLARGRCCGTSRGSGNGSARGAPLQGVKTRAMLSGFNTNVRHRSRLFHVQSEDSGRNHPHIITHLYHRGTIVASEKSSYADRLEAPDLPEVVRELMETQHKAVLRRLVSGQFDSAIRERLGDDALGDDPGDTRSHMTPAELAGAAAETDATTLREPSREANGDVPAPERPLDEVILDYLVENARQRKRRSK
jgi:hypothetical protein